MTGKLVIYCMRPAVLCRESRLLSKDSVGDKTLVFCLIPECLFKGEH